MPPPSESASAAKRKSPTRRIVLVAVVAVAIGAAFAYTAMHPARLMAQAHHRGHTGSTGYTRNAITVIPDPPCPRCPADSTSNASQPTAAETSVILPDGSRTVTLKTINPDDTDDLRAGRPRSARRELDLESIDVPAREVTLSAAPPREIQSLIGVTDDLELFGSSWNPDETTVSVGSARDKRTVLLFRFGIVGNHSAMRRIAVLQPSPGTIREMATSPQGDRILWIILSQRQPYKIVALAAKQIKALSRFGASESILSVWETNGVGDNPIKIGDEPELGLQAGSWPSSFAYEPGGRTIRFVYGREIFELAAPRRI